MPEVTGVLKQVDGSISRSEKSNIKKILEDYLYLFSKVKKDLCSGKRAPCPYVGV